MSAGNGRIRLRDVVVIVLLPFIAVSLLIFPVWVADRFSQDALATHCQLIEININELTTLELIAERLGLPTADIVIPRRPRECVELSQ